MSDDLNKKIKQITDILGQENIPDNVKGLLSLLTSSDTKEEPHTLQNTELPSGKEEKSERNELDENVDMVRKVKKVMDKLNTNNDPRINLLTAIKPFLNSRRQKKLVSCIKMLQMSSLTKLFDDHEKGIF